MKAQILKQTKTPLELEDRSDMTAGPGAVVIQVEAAALNRRDFWMSQGMYPGLKLPVVPGSDGAGVVVETGSGLGNFWQGREVIINPGWDWGDNPRVQSNSFHILGMPEDGTFATHVEVPREYLHDKPAHLNWQEAAALPLAGVTAYRALFTQGELQASDTVLVNGIGGGVATFALQFAVASGAKVWVTSSSDQKIVRAVEMGARGGFDYTNDDWSKEMAKEAGAPDLIIDSAGGAGYGSLINLAAPGGRIVNYGATTGPPEKLDLFKIFWKQLRLQGSTMGSPADFTAMLDLVNKHNIRPVIDRVFPLTEVNDALGLMKTSPQFGKYVLTTS